jgi:hypothetical protein
VREGLPCAEAISGFGVSVRFPASGVVRSLLTTVAFVAALAAAIVHLRAVVDRAGVAAPAADASGAEGTAGRPGDAEARDGLLA